jgi:hypothetical protein
MDQFGYISYTKAYSSDEKDKGTFKSCSFEIKNQNMVEVFKTNVYAVSNSKKIIELLYQHYPECKINFDLDDCDNILRVEGSVFETEKIKLIVNENGYMCEELE